MQFEPETTAMRKTANTSLPAARTAKRQLLQGCAIAAGLAALAYGGPALAQVGGIPAFNVSEGNGGSTYSLSLQILALMTALTLLPSLVLGMTSFTRIIIVLSILRQAMGTQQTPPNQVLARRAAASGSTTPAASC